MFRLHNTKIVHCRLGYIIVTEKEYYKNTEMGGGRVNFDGWGCLQIKRHSVQKEICFFSQLKIPKCTGTLEELQDHVFVFKSIT